MKVNAVIDRIEGSKAVLLVGEQEESVNWPRCCLPDDIAEGDIINVKISVDVEATCSAREEASKLLAELSKN